MKRFLLAVSLAATALAAYAFFQRQDSPKFQYDPDRAYFPEVTGENLNKESFALPKDLAGKYNLVFLAYQRQQQDEVDTWIPLATKLSKEFPNLKFYELPTLPNYSKDFQNFIDNGMRSGIPDPATRAITITLYLDQKSFLKALHIDSTKTIHAALVDQKGNLLWIHAGKHTDEAEKSLRELLTSLP